MKIVLLGANGQVGRELARVLPAIGDVVACDRAAADLERPAEVVALLARERPAAIVNAAAYTAVDRAESEPERAELVNATAVAAIAAQAARQAALFVHYSTDYVFDGTAPDCYRETDEPRPLSVYGATKLRVSKRSPRPAAATSFSARAGSTPRTARTSCGRSSGWPGNGTNSPWWPTSGARPLPRP